MSIRIPGRALRSSLVVWLAATVANSVGVAAAPLPSWLVEVASRPTPGYGPEVPAVVLLDESSMAVGPGAGVSTHRRYAMRVLTQAGEKLAVLRFDYLAGTETVKNNSAWILRNGKPVKLPKAIPWADVVADLGASAYNEYRAKLMDYSEVAAIGDVIACEGDVAGSMLFAHTFHAWTNELPALVERFQVTAPKGWTVQAGRDGPMSLLEERTASDRTTTVSWTLRDLPYRPDEPLVSSDGAFHARAFISFVPPTSASDLPMARFQSWSDVAAWWRKIVEDQCDSSPALAAQARQLVADCSDDVSRARAIAAYVQRLRYVSVNRKIGIGFGYRPRKASEVFSRGWGDCKDKSNLMCAMLRQVGVPATIAAARGSGGRDVNGAWPSPEQFDHAIVAVQLPAGSGASTTVTTQSMGELTFFDPTSPHTWFGDLPYLLQGSTVHVIGETRDELVKLPRLDSEQILRMEREIRATLSANGAMQGTCEFVASGQAGATLRELVRGWSARQLEENAGEFISDVLRGSTVTNIQLNDNVAAGHSTLSLEFSTPKAVQPLPGGGMLVRLDLLSRRGLPAFPAKTRALPIELPPYFVVDRVRLEIPPGLEAEAPPAPAARETGFGAYSMAIAAEGSTVVAHRTLRLTGQTVPVDGYPKLRQFLNDVVAADKAAVVVKPAD